MAKISTYPIISLPTFNDLLIGTDVENLNETKNFTIGDIADLIIVGNYVPYIGAIDDVDLGIHSITASSFIVPGGLSTEFVKADGSLDSTVYQPAGNYITGLSGEATASGPGVSAVVLSNGAVIGKVLTGLTITGGSISSSDSILQAFGKLQNQVNGLYGGAIYQGTWNALTNTPTLTSSVGTQGYYYIVSVAGNTVLDGISDWNVGDWAIFDGTAWQQVDNTDTVVSVNGQVGIVVLTTTDIAEGTNLYYTDTRARASLTLTTTGSSGASTYNNLTGAFNIPNYTLSGLGGVPSSRQLSINGTAYDLSSDRSWSVGTVTSIGTSGPLTGGTITGSGTIGITQSGAASDGYLSSTDWNIFNNKQNALVNPVTGTGTVYYIPMWSAVTALTDSIISYSSNVVNYNYNSASGATVNYINTNGTAYTYTIQMNNTGTRQTYHSYTDGNIIQRINSNDVSRNLQSGQLVLPYYTTLGSFTGTSVGYLGFDASGNILTVSALSSVGISMPSAFTVSNSPLTSNGTIAVTGAGLASQYVRGDGTLADFPTGGGGGGASVTYYLNGSVNQGTFGGNVYYQMDKVPIIGTGTDFSRGTNGYIAQFITDVGVPNALLIPGGNWNLEFYFSASSGGGAPSFYVELYKYNGTTFTLISSNSATPETITGGTSIDAYFTSLAVPETILAATDRLAIRIYVTTVGRTITLHTENSHLCEIITTFTTGLTTLNGLTKQVQYFAVGTSGTDFNISSSVDTHTFNLPTASAVNRGALSSADWSVFNSKVGGTGATGQVAYWNGTNSQTGSNNLFWDAANARLGIGTNAPTRKLHLVGTSALFQNAGTFELDLLNTTSGNYLRATAGTTDSNIGTIQNIPFSFIMNGSRVGQFTSTNGNLILQNGGTFTDAGYRLDVQGTARVTDAVTFGSDINLSRATTPAIVSTTNQNIRLRTNSFEGVFRTDGVFITTTGFRTDGFVQTVNLAVGASYYNTAAPTNGAIIQGNVGIGTTSPSAKLDVVGAATFSSSVTANDVYAGSGTQGIIGLRAGGAGAAGFMEIFTTNGTTRLGYIGYNTTNMNYVSENSANHVFQTNGSSERMRLTSGGNLLVGTTVDSGYKLDVNGTGRIQSNLFVGVSGGANYIALAGDAASNGSFWYQDATQTILSAVAAIPIIFRTTNTERFRIASTGAATFSSSVTATVFYSSGATSPTSGLIIEPIGWNGAKHRLNVPTSGNTSMWSFNWNGSARDYVSYGSSTIQVAENLITFSNGTGNPSEVARFNGSNLLVGTTTDSGGRLQVSGNISVNTSGQARTISTYYATGSDGVNIWIGGGGQSSTFTAGATYQGSYNSAMGVSALYSNTTGYYNSAIGVSALISNTTGYYNSAMGGAALIFNTTGYYNSAMGGSALYSNTTGNSNTALGFQAGYGTGTNANTTGSNNIFIGKESVGVSATESNRTWIGNSATTSTWVGGNLLVGTTADQGYRVQITGSGDNMLNVWGATAPSIRLDNAASGASQRFVIGLATGTNQFIQGASAGDVCITTATSSPMVFGMWQTSTSEEVMRITTSKNLLINKTADGGQKLQVSGKVNFASLPTSSAGLSAGDIWNNGGVLNIV